MGFSIDLPFGLGGYSETDSPAQPNYQYGFSQSSGLGSSQSTSYSEVAPSKVWGPQAGYLQDLYGKAQTALGQAAPAQQAAAGLVNQGYQGIEQLLNPQVNPMLQVYQEQLQRGMEQNILPAIRREAQGFGQYGGSRQGVAEGLAAQEAGRMSRDFAAQVYGEDMNRLLGATSLIPTMADAGMGVPWFGLQQYAGILGQPTVLSGGSRSGSQSTGQQVQSAFGENVSSREPNVLPPQYQLPAEPAAPPRRFNPDR